MIYSGVFLLCLVASIQASFICPPMISGYPVCWGDEKYKNLCELQIAKTLDISLDLVYVSRCKDSSYQHRAQQENGNDSNEGLKSRKRKNHKNKGLSSSSSGPGDADDQQDYLKRLSSMPFNFRRYQDGQVEEDED